MQLELESLLDKEDVRWKQWAKANWLMRGDRNTKFYHACANQRRKTNLLSKIIDEDGVTWESLEDIQVAFVDYFSNLFKVGPTIDIETCIQPITPKVTEEMNGALLEISLKKRLELH
jgi:hypothetical protein